MQNAGGVPPDQDILLPLAGPEPWFCPGQEAWQDYQDRRPHGSSPHPQRAARLPAVYRSSQFQGEYSIIFIYISVGYVLQ